MKAALRSARLGETPLEIMMTCSAKPRPRTPCTAFLPTTAEELRERDWDAPDIILVTGDAYIDSPSMGVALVGRVLEAAGYRVAVIGQPDCTDTVDIARLGEPKLFWGVTGGSVDSLVANRTASGKRRKSDDFTPGGGNTRRPDRAVIAYANLIRRAFKGTRPIVLGGIEASLRRIAHYDFWDNRVRRSILFDAKADYLLYGMADESVVALAGALAEERDPRGIRGLCFIAREQPDGGYLQVPPHEEAAADLEAFLRMFRMFHEENDAVRSQGLIQAHGDRWLVQNPPPLPLAPESLERIHGLPFAREVHPFYLRQGTVKAIDTIRFSITTHRGCYGECAFCAIAAHQGRTVQSRGLASIVAEAEAFVSHPAFRGTIADVGGATANMYGIECPKKIVKGACRKKRCLSPAVCPSLPVDHGRQLELLAALRRVPGVKKVVVASGIRHDLVLADKKHGRRYLEEVVRHHVSGQMKVAPEHSEAAVLALMGKPGWEQLLRFRKLFEDCTRAAGLPQFLTYYLIAAHPGCTEAQMRAMRKRLLRDLRVLPEQVQIFTPTPATWSTCMYWTGKDPRTGKPLFVERSVGGRVRQKAVLEIEKQATPRPCRGTPPV